MLVVNDLTVKICGRKIVDSANFRVKEKEWLMIVGPNGAGKSTVVNAISQGVPYTGSILFDGEDISRCKPVERAKKLGVLMQYHFVGYSFTVEEVVKMGRYAYSPGMFSTINEESNEKIRAAMDQTGILSIKDQSVLTLSGGELQRTFLAQLLAQDPQLLILDEPTNHLDLIYQKQIFGLVKEWIDHTGRAVISVVHDLSLAKAYGTNALLMDDGKLLASGSIEETLTRSNLENAYSMDVHQWMQELFHQWDEN